MTFKLNKNEYIIFEARRSWIVLFSKSIGWIFSILIPIFIFSIIESIEIITFSGNPNALLMIFVFTWIFIVWNFIFVEWTDYYLDILVITNKHLIDIEQKGLFVRDVAVTSLENVEDITTVITGFVATVIGYGDLKVQSAGAKTEFIIKDIDSPTLVREKIKEAITGENQKSEE